MIKKDSKFFISCFSPKKKLKVNSQIKAKHDITMSNFIAIKQNDK